MWVYVYYGLTDDWVGVSGGDRAASDNCFNVGTIKCHLR